MSSEVTQKIAIRDAERALKIDAAAAARHDAVEHPQHYTAHPSGIECIQITEHMNFNLGNAVKYIWRAGEKGDRMEDLRKARWYLDREITRLEASCAPPKCDPQCSEGHMFDETCAAPGGGRFDG